MIVNMGVVEYCDDCLCLEGGIDGYSDSCRLDIKTFDDRNQIVVDNHNGKIGHSWMVRPQECIDEYGQ